MSERKAFLVRVVEQCVFGLVGGAMMELIALGLAVTGFVGLDVGAVLRFAPVALFGGLVFGLLGVFFDERGRLRRWPKKDTPSTRGRTERTEREAAGPTMSDRKASLNRVLEFGGLGLICGVVAEIMALGLAISGIVRLDVEAVLRLAPVLVFGGLVFGLLGVFFDERGGLRRWPKKDTPSTRGRTD